MSSTPSSTSTVPTPPTQRRTLASQDRHLHPRCDVPDWFDTLRADTIDELDQAWENYNREQQKAADLDQQIKGAERQLNVVRQYTRPFNDEVTTAKTALDAAEDCQHKLATQLATANRRERRILQPALAIADQDLQAAMDRHHQAVTAAEPARALVAQADRGLGGLRDEQWRQRMYAPLFADPERITALQDRIDALDTWRQWANGHQLTPTRVQEMNNGLFVANDSISELFTLRRALFDDTNTATIIHRANRAIERSRGPELSID